MEQPPGIAESSPRPSVWSVLGWASYLACSWTWCIGMYLPVILHRDMGPMSYLAFVMPNAVGAALFGLVLRRPGASQRLVERHRWACVTFSGITLSFQAFFLTWLAMGWGRVGLLLMLGALAIGLAATARRERAGWVTTLGVGLLLASLGCGAWWLLGGHGEHFLTPATARADQIPWLAPVLVLGFGLCPYLDLTFHRARQQLPGDAGNAAFVIGFLALFPLLVQFTAMYAPSIIGEATSRGVSMGPQLGTLAVGVHMAIQLGFTIGVHNAEASARGGSSSAPWGIPVGFLLGLACWLGWIQPVVGGSAFEMVYRVFMGFYGLVFPAYVWLVVWPARGGRPTRASWIALAGAIVGACPFYYFGFIEHRTWLLAPGVGIVLLARLFVRGRPPEPA